MNVILIGYRGCGKSTLGEMLAEQIWKDFIDVDREVCKAFGQESIKAIWAEHGQAKWREAEAEATEQACGKSDMVIALGGGALTHPRTRRVVESAEDALRIYLKCEPPELYRRIKADPNSAEARPDLTDQGGFEEVQRVLREREPVYREVADKEFDVTHVNPASAVRYLIDRCL